MEVEEEWRPISSPPEIVCSDLSEKSANGIIFLEKIHSLQRKIDLLHAQMDVQQTGATNRENVLHEQIMLLQDQLLTKNGELEAAEWKTKTFQLEFEKISLDFQYLRRDHESVLKNHDSLIEKLEKKTQSEATMAQRLRELKYQAAQDVTLLSTRLQEEIEDKQKMSEHFEKFSKNPQVNVNEEGENDNVNQSDSVNHMLRELCRVENENNDLQIQCHELKNQIVSLLKEKSQNEATIDILEEKNAWLTEVLKQIEEDALSSLSVAENVIQLELNGDNFDVTPMTHNSVIQTSPFPISRFRPGNLLSQTSGQRRAHQSFFTSPETLSLQQTPIQIQIGQPTQTQGLSQQNIAKALELSIKNVQKLLIRTKAAEENAKKHQSKVVEYQNLLEQMEKKHQRTENQLMQHAELVQSFVQKRKETNTLQKVALEARDNEISLLREKCRQTFEAYTLLLTKYQAKELASQSSQTLLHSVVTGNIHGSSSIQTPYVVDVIMGLQKRIQEMVATTHELESSNHQLKQDVISRDIAISAWRSQEAAMAVYISNQKHLAEIQFVTKCEMV